MTEQEVQVLPAWVHAWGSEPKVVCLDKIVLFKSMPVFSPRGVNPDAVSLSFEIPGTNLVGCSLCNTEVRAGRGGWGFKSHCLRCHPWLCNYEDIVHHNPSILNVMEKAYGEAVETVRLEESPVGQKRKPGMAAYLIVGGGSRPDKNGSLKEAVVKCVCLNLLPFTFAESPGFNTILSFLNRSNEGLSARSVVLAMHDLYLKTKIEKLEDFILAFDIKRGDDGKMIFEEEKHERICGVTHDMFTSSNGNMPMLALNIHYINRRRPEGWKMMTFLLGCVQMPPPHDAESVLEKIEEICSFWGFPLFIFLAATQDTTPASLNVFQSVDTAEQLPCFSHTNQLCMKWSVSDVAFLSECFKKMSAINAMIKSRPKRLGYIEDAALALEHPLVIKRPVLHCDTRWDIFDKVADNVFHNLPAYLAIDATVVFKDGRVAWQSAIDFIVTEKPVVELVQPYLKLCAQWTQVLSSRKAVTVSIVRLAVRSLRQWEIAARARNEEVLIAGNLVERRASEKFEVFLNALHTRQTQYFGDDFYNAGVYVVAEFLDPRTIWALEDDAGLRECKRIMKTLAPVAATRVPHGAAARAPRAADPGGSFLASYVPPGPANGPRMSPLDVDVREYIACLQNELTEKEAMKCDPLDFWTVYGQRFPILADIAVRVLSIPPSEAECERTFSITGRTHTKARNSLKGDNINQVVSLHQWLQMDDENVSKASALRSANAEGRASRFATLKLIDETRFAPDPADVEEEEVDEEDEDEQ